MCFSDTIEGLEKQIDKLMKMCQSINLKLSPSKFKLSTAVKFGGTVISSQKIKDGHVIFLDPPDSRILAVTEMATPRTKKELRTLCGMIASLRDWFPSIQFNMENLRAGCAHMRNFEWTNIMEEEFNAVKKIFTHQIRLSPLDVEKKINIVTDGANSAGVGFVLFQNADDLKQGENVSIVKANSSGLKDCQKQYFAVDTEVLALKFACDASLYYLYGAPLIHVYTDYSSLESIFNKPLGDIKMPQLRTYR